MQLCTSGKCVSCRACCLFPSPVRQTSTNKVIHTTYPETTISNLYISQEGYYKTGIAGLIGVHNSTITREIKRNNKQCDNSPKYVSQPLMCWAHKEKKQLLSVQPGDSQQNAYKEHCNRTVRHKMLNQRLFESNIHAQETAIQWLWHYNNA